MRLINWFKFKKKQIGALLADDELRLAVASEISEPEEGAEFDHGQIISLRNFAGLHRRLKICGTVSGGYSTVYTVIDLDEMKAYCLKASRLLLTDERVRFQKLIEEIKIWSDLQSHPNILHLNSVYHYNNRLYVLMEYVSGSDLRARLKQSPLDLETALGFALQICRGLAHAQREIAGFVHGDLKPGNCLVTDDGVLKIMDFGLSRSVSQPNKFAKNFDSDLNFAENAVSNITGRNRAGTLPYMAPEQFGEASIVTERSDIYSFGVTLFEMTTGVKPFKGTSREDFSNQHTSVQPADPREINRNISADLSDLILKCLSKTPADRPASFAVLEKQLNAILENDFHKFEPAPRKSELTAAEAVERGRIFAALNDLETANLWFKKALALNESQTEVWALSGIVNARLGDLAEARESLAKVRELRVASFAVSFHEALLNFEIGDYADALDCTNVALRLKPDSSPALDLKGKILEKLQSNGEAEVCYKKSHSLDPHNVEALLSLAKLQSQANKFLDALTLIEKAYRLNPKKVEVVKSFGDLCANLLQFENAVKYYKQAKNLEPNDEALAESLLGNACRYYRSANERIEGETMELLVEGFNYKRRGATDLIQKITNSFSTSNFDLHVLFLLDDEIYAALNFESSENIEAFAQSLWKAAEACNFGEAKHLLHSIGKSLYGAEQYELCTIFFLRLINRVGHDEKAYYYLAACNETTGNDSLAFYYYKEAEKLNGQCELIKTGKNRTRSKLKKKITAENG